MAGKVGPPAEVEVVAEQRQPRVEAAELVPDVAPDEHPGAADRQHVAYGVVLALVDLPPVEAGVPVTGAVGGEADLEQQPRLVPAAGLGPEHGCGRRVLGPLQQRLEAAGVRGAVVVQQPHPLDRLAVAGPRPVRRHRGPGVGLETERDRRAEAGGPLGVDDPAGTEPGGQDPHARVVAAGVDGDRPLGRPGLRLERGKAAPQPPLTVVGDENSGDQVARKRWAHATRRHPVREGVEGHHRAGG